MKKALIPAAILLSLAGAAHAELSIYGLIDLSYGKNEIVGDKEASFHSGGDSGSSQGNSTTKFGLKGTTDVGSGIKANFKLESSGIQSDGSLNGAMFGRQAWAGLSGSFGEVRLGRQDSVAFQTMIGFDANGAANAASGWYNAGISPIGPGRQNGSLQYLSNDFSGFKFQLGFQPEGNAPDTTGLDDGKANYQVGLTYTAGPLVIAATADSKHTESGEDFAAIAASYDFGAAKLAVFATDAGDNAKGSGFGISAPIGGYTVGLNYGANSKSTKAKGTEVFINREVLKNTIVYLDLGQLKADGAEKQNAYALGVIYTF